MKLDLCVGKVGDAYTFQGTAPSNELHYCVKEDGQIEWQNDEGQERKQYEEDGCLIASLLPRWQEAIDKGCLDIREISLETANQGVAMEVALPGCPYPVQFDFDRSGNAFVLHYCFIDAPKTIYRIECDPGRLLALTVLRFVVTGSSIRLRCLTDERFDYVRNLMHHLKK